MPEYIPFEHPTTDDGEYTAVLNEGEKLITRRIQLGLTQRQVADMADICLSQYQRLEDGDRLVSGCSMKIGLAVCSVLLLNPLEVIDLNVANAAQDNMKRPAMFDTPSSHRAGRKKVRKDIMEVLISADGINVQAPVIESLGKPEYIRCLYEPAKRRILLSAAVTADTEDVFPVGRLIPCAGIVNAPQRYSVKCRLVQNWSGQRFILADLNTAEITIK